MAHNDTVENLVEEFTEQEEMREVFGCDIGNGFGFISLLQNPTSDPIPMFPAKYKLDAIGMPTSAYVAPPDGTSIEVFNKRPARSNHKREPEKFIHAVKTRLKEGIVELPGISLPVSTDAIYSAIARDLILLGNEERKNRGEAPIYDIVYTFPASFAKDIALLNRMQNSIERIRFGNRKVKVVGRLPEPAAVAIDYLYYMQHIAPENVRLKEESCTVLVYDLGHGTFDTAVVTASSKGNPYQLYLHDGLPDVGGKDFDKILYEEICRILKEEYDYIPQNDNERETIHSTATEIKHELTENETASSSIFLPNGELVDIEITRSRFEELSRYLLNQTLELVENMMQQANIDQISIDAVVLSGGSSQMPMIKQGLSLLLEETLPIYMYRPSEAVSYGAARFAYSKRRKNKNHKKNTEQRKTLDTEQILDKFTEYSYGIWTPSKEKLAGAIEVMVKSKEKLPVESEWISFVSSSSRVVVRLYRSIKKYVTESIADVEDCEELIRVPFEVLSNTECEFKIVVLEDYNVKVLCRPLHGEVMEKSTSDMLGTLI